jgi:hypothetical protein
MTAAYLSGGYFLDCMERKCLDCGSTLVGRIDKKFCDDACRSNYNKSRESDRLRYVRTVNSILKKNRKILEELNPEGKTKVAIKRLQRRGFDFRYFTHLYETSKGSQYRFCYEYGYLMLPFEMILLVKREEDD